jgi:hypothetical protein
MDRQLRFFNHRTAFFVQKKLPLRKHDKIANVLALKSNAKIIAKEPLSLFSPGLPDFSWYMIPKPEKCTK